MFDKFKEECGVFAVYNHPEASNLTYLGLYALQHRGQESAGIVSSNGKILYSHKSMGLVSDIFDEDAIKRLEGESAIGHVRYSTTGESHVKNAQPFLVNYAGGEIAVAHNGNIVNAQELRDELEAEGSIFQSTMDTEVIVHLIAKSKAKTLVDRIAEALSKCHGAYSIVFLTRSRVIAARDPRGFRPLCMGNLGDAKVIASETCAFDLIDAVYEREIEPGEIVEISSDGVKSYFPFDKVKKAHCVFEYIYFARPDSSIFGKNVYGIRKNFGKMLARENPVSADIVFAVPDSGIIAAMGYAEESKIPFEMGLVRNHYVGRTFIEPSQSIRHFGVKIKLNAVRDVIKGKRVVVIDDSIVRGTTSRKIVKMIRHAGAKEVHMRITAPPTISPCFYGIDTPTRKELIASSHSVDEICKYVTADSLAYLSIDGMRKCVEDMENAFCKACFDGEYPMDFHAKHEGKQLALFG